MVQALEGIRVVELGGGIAVPSATKLLGDFGAEVIKVEPPDGDAARGLGPFPSDVPSLEQSAIFLHLNRNKYGVTLDVFKPTGFSLFKQLIEQSDVLVTAYSPAQLDELGIDLDRLHAINPALVWVAVTPWGLTGPYRDYSSSEIVLDGFGHSMFSHGVAEREPLTMGGDLHQYYAGEVAALAALSGYLTAEQSGQGQLIDVSMIEAQLSSVDRRSVQLLRYQYTGRVVRRNAIGSTTGNLRSGFHPCLDGWVHSSFRVQHFRQLCELTGNETWLENPAFQPISEKFQTAEVQEALSTAFLGWTMQRTQDEIAEEARRSNLPAFPVKEFGSLLDDVHLSEREFWVEHDHPVAGRLKYPGRPWIMDRGGYEQRMPAPLLGQHNAEILGGRLGLSGEQLSALSTIGIVSGNTDPRHEDAISGSRSPAPPRQVPSQPAGPARLPLEGIRVIDMTAVWAGPSAAMMLGDLGAEVIRVESMQFFPATTRGWFARPPKDLEGLPIFANAYADFDPGERPWNRFAGFNAINRNKLSMTADLSRPEGVEIFKRLAEASDIVIDNYSFKTMEKLGLGYEALRQVNPRIIQLSMPLFGNSGPYKALRGMGSFVDAFSGFLAMRRYPDFDVSVSQPVTYMDAVTGPGVAFSVICALREREVSGQGQFIDFAQSENLLQEVGEYFIDYQRSGRNPSPLGNRDRWRGLQGCYGCRESDTWLVVTVRTDEEWERLREVLGRPNWMDAPEFATALDRFANHDAFDQHFGSWAKQQEASDAMTLLQRGGVTAARVMNEADVYQDPHVAAREFFISTTHPEAGTHEYPGFQWRASLTPLRHDRYSPLLGEDNQYLYCGILGYSSEEYEQFVRDDHAGVDYMEGVAAF